MEPDPCTLKNLLPDCDQNGCLLMELKLLSLEKSWTPDFNNPLFYQPH
jgi:hypothetical protein